MSIRVVMVGDLSTLNTGDVPHNGAIVEATEIRDMARLGTLLYEEVEVRPAGGLDILREACAGLAEVVERDGLFEVRVGDRVLSSSNEPALALRGLVLLAVRGWDHAADFVEGFDRGVPDGVLSRTEVVRHLRARGRG